MSAPEAHHFQRNKSLDGLRALAIGIVLVHHYRDTRFFLSGFGAILFFVLSGFFATRILLKLRAGMEHRQSSLSGAFRGFYFQRWLRIWPLYFIVLAITLLLDVPNAHSSFFWNAAFLTNIEVLVNGSWSGRFSPLWSLSVLEQFYIIWPVVILCTPRRHLMRVIVAFIAVAPLYRIGCMLTSAPSLYWCVVPLASLDQLGVGALLALCETETCAVAREKIVRFAGQFCLPAFVFFLVLKGLAQEPPFSAIYTASIASFAFLWLINCCLTGLPAPARIVFENRYLCHIGKMSYSIYLLHDFTQLLIPKTGLFGVVLESPWKTPALILLTLLVAEVAWRLIERPVCAFKKKRFPSVAALQPALSPLAPWPEKPYSPGSGD